MTAKRHPAPPLRVDQVSPLVRVVLEVKYPNNTPVRSLSDDFDVLVPGGTLQALVVRGMFGVLVPEEDAGGVVVEDARHGCVGGGGGGS